MRNGKWGLVHATRRGATAVMAAVALVVVVAAASPVFADEHDIVWGASIPLTGIYAQAGELGSVGMTSFSTVTWPPFGRR